MNQLPLIEGEPLSVSDPRDYRRGMLLGFALMILGIISGIVFATLLALGLITGRFGFGTIAAVVAGMLWVGAFAGGGFLLMHKGRLGLWIVYLLTADFLYVFCKSTFHLLSTGTRDNVYHVIWNCFCFTIWLSIAAYFHNRRKQFTQWWDSTGTSESFQKAHEVEATDEHR